jgi:uncharacterized protein
MKRLLLPVTNKMTFSDFLDFYRLLQKGAGSPTNGHPKEKTKMAGKFELKESRNGKFFFNLLAANKQIILSSEMYESKSSAEKGIASVQKNATDDTRYERLTSAKGEPYFTLKAGNNQVIGTSEMYKSTSSRDNGIASVKTNAPGAPVVEA